MCASIHSVGVYYCPFLKFIGTCCMRARVKWGFWGLHAGPRSRRCSELLGCLPVWPGILVDGSRLTEALVSWLGFGGWGLSLSGNARRFLPRATPPWSLCGFVVVVKQMSPPLRASGIRPRCYAAFGLAPMFRLFCSW